jgi:hypothetical protein
LSREKVQHLLEEFAARLDTVGQVHRLLAQGSNGAPIDVAKYLETIAQGLVSSLTANEQTRLECVFPLERSAFRRRHSRRAGDSLRIRLAGLWRWRS